MLNLIHSLPRALGVIVGSLALTGGAVGAAASAGGTEVPRPVEAVLEVIGFNTNSAGRHASPSPTSTPGPRRPKATTTATPVPQSLPGLCNAYRSGSERGREQKQNGTAFARLLNAAKAEGQDIETFCASLTPRKRATAAPTATAAGRRPAESRDRGPQAEMDRTTRSDDSGRGKSNDDRRSPDRQAVLGAAVDDTNEGSNPGKSRELRGQQDATVTSGLSQDGAARATSKTDTNAAGSPRGGRR